MRELESGVVDERPIKERFSREFKKAKIKRIKNPVENIGEENCVEGLVLEVHRRTCEVRLNEKEVPAQGGHDNAIRTIALDKKKLNKILREYADADLSEMFRLWLSEQGFRFPIGFFYSQTEPAHVKIPVRAAYRKRSIVKNGSTVLICEFESVEAALKFVSCK